MSASKCCLSLISCFFWACTAVVGPVQAQSIPDVLNIDLDEAQATAEKYLERWKAGDFPALFKMHYRPEGYDPADEAVNQKAHRAMLQIYRDELGSIQSYTYRSMQWRKPFVQRHWSKEKDPSNDPTTQVSQKPGSVTLTYAVRYQKDTVNTTIEILNQNGVLKVRRFGLKYPFDRKTMQRMIRFHQKATRTLPRQKGL